MKKHIEFFQLFIQATLAAGSAGIVALYKVTKQATPATLAAFKKSSFERASTSFNAMVEAELEELKAYIEKGESL